MKKSISISILLFVLSTTVFGQISFNQQPSILLTSTSLYSAMINSADMNNDGKDDIVSISNDGSFNWLRIDYQDGQPSNWALNLPGNIMNFVVADANDDNLQDIVLISGNSLYMFFHDSLGFSCSPSYVLYCGELIDAVATADFNKDGTSDFVVSCNGSDTMRIITQLYNGSGFGMVNLYGVQGGTNQLKTGDVNNDGWDDIIFLTGQSSLTGVYIYLNDGIGSFNPYSYFGFTNYWGGSQVTDNVVIANIFGTGNCVVINTGGLSTDNTKVITYQNGIFTTQLFTLPGFDKSAFAADFNSDGTDEIVYLKIGDPSLNIVQFFGPTITGTSSYSIISGNYHSLDQAITTLDFIGHDGKIDIATISDWGEITIMKNDLISTNISEQKSESQCTIYPNPTTDYLNISLNQLGEYTMIISDISGRIVLDKKYHGQQCTIDVSDFPKGIYSLRISGKEKFSHKFIVQ